MRFIVCMLALVLMTAGQALGQQTFTSESKSWSFEMPAGWSLVSFDKIKQFDQGIQSRLPAKDFHFVAGFTRNSTTTLTFPYVLIQVSNNNPLAGMSYDEIERVISSRSFTNARDKTAAAFVSGLSGDTTLDRAHNRLVSHMSFTANGQTLRNVSYDYLGASTQVQVHCYDLASRGSASDAAFESFASTFAFAPGHQFVPGAEGLSEEAKAEKVGYAMGKLVGILVIAILAVAVRKAFKRS